MVDEKSATSTEAFTDSDPSDWDEQDDSDTKKIKFEIKPTARSIATIDELKATVQALKRLTDLDRLSKPNSRRNQPTEEKLVTPYESKPSEGYSIIEAFTMAEDDKSQPTTAILTEDIERFPENNQQSHEPNCSPTPRIFIHPCWIGASFLFIFILLLILIFSLSPILQVWAIN